MKTLVEAIIGFALLMSSSFAFSETIVRYGANDLGLGFPEIEGVTVSVDLVDGQRSAVRVENEKDEPVFVALAAVDKALGDGVLKYSAMLRSHDLSGRAFLEMHCVFPTGGEYFSRALHDTLSGSRDWKRFSTLFYLSREEECERVILGVRMEGPGTVWIDDLQLERQAGDILRMTQAGGVFGAVIGSLIGLWGACGGLLAPKGKGRTFVMVYGWLLFAMGIIILLAGFGMLFSGVTWSGVQSWIWSGALATLLMGVFLPVIRNAYRRTEEAKMQAQDDSNTVSS